MKKMNTSSLFNKARDYSKFATTFTNLIDDCWEQFDFNPKSDFVANRLASIFGVTPDEIKCYIALKNMN